MDSSNVTNESSPALSGVQQARELLQDLMAENDLDNHLPPKEQQEIKHLIARYFGRKTVLR